MKDKIVVIGGGGWGRVIINALKKLNIYEILGYTDLVDKGTLFGIRYLGNDDILKDIIKKYTNCNAVLGVGNIIISKTRIELFEKIKKIGFIFPVIISPNAIINEGVEIDEGTVVLDGAVLCTCAKIGKCAIVSSNVILEHDSSSGDFVNFCAGAILSGGAAIGDNSLLGVSAIIVGFKKVGRDCFIGPGSVVIKDLLLPGTYFGSPARKISISE